jgi:hypothetical protein
MAAAGEAEAEPTRPMGAAGDADAEPTRPMAAAGGADAQSTGPMGAAGEADAERGRPLVAAGEADAERGRPVVAAGEAEAEPTRPMTAASRVAERELVARSGGERLRALPGRRAEKPIGVRVIPAARTVAGHLHRAQRERDGAITRFDMWAIRVFGSVAAVAFISLLVMILKAFFVF